MIVVSGPIAAVRADRRVALAGSVPGSITVSRPIVTSTSMCVVAGSTIVTPCALWRSWMRCCASADAREVDAVVDAERERRVGRSTCAAIVLPGLAQRRQHVGQVELALGVVGVELRRARASSAPPSKA